MNASTTGLRVAPLEAADETDWRVLWTGYLTFYGATVGEDVYAATWSRLLLGGAGEFRGLIARDDAGSPVGLAHYLFHRHCWRVENVCYLQDLFVASEKRDLGAGRALIEAVYAAADAEGAGNVYWLTQTGNSTARRLYDRIGAATDFMKYNRH